MKIKHKIVRGRLLRRYKRFLADVELEAGGERVTAHCPDPGSMLSVAQPGRRVLLAQYTDPRRKLEYGLEFIHSGRCWIGVHPARANALVREALELERLPEFAGYRELRQEVYFETARSSERRTRFDFYLGNRAGRFRLKDCFLEVKSVSLLRSGVYGFPDSVTERGQRHLRALIAARRAGHRAALLFVIQRSDGSRLALAEDIDPEYARLARDARRAGVEFLAYGARTRVSQAGVSIALGRPVELKV